MNKELFNSNTFSSISPSKTRWKLEPQSDEVTEVSNPAGQFNDKIPSAFRTFIRNGVAADHDTPCKYVLRHLPKGYSETKLYEDMNAIVEKVAKSNPSWKCPDKVIRSTRIIEPMFREKSKRGYSMYSSVVVFSDPTSARLICNAITHQTFIGPEGKSQAISVVPSMEALVDDISEIKNTDTSEESFKDTKLYGMFLKLIENPEVSVWNTLTLSHVSEFGDIIAVSHEPFSRPDPTVATELVKQVLLNSRKSKEVKEAKNKRAKAAQEKKNAALAGVKLGDDHPKAKKSRKQRKREAKARIACGDCALVSPSTVPNKLLSRSAVVSISAIVESPEGAAADVKAKKGAKKVKQLPPSTNRKSAKDATRAEKRKLRKKAKAFNSAAAAAETYAEEQKQCLSPAPSVIMKRPS
eukprot:GHVH01001000.1.p1 GENE.GHVH01001000.1~~GHVH01001000.1.p1  ORF type:complete len:410 (+),score=53.60 GHVH01001000.1:108-1337(+)